MRLRIGLDLDDTICSFSSGYLKRFGHFPKYDWAISRNVNHILINEPEFWLNLPIIRMPDFEPRLFCSARVNNKRWTKKYLKQHGLYSPLYQIPGYHLSKADVLKHRVDVFVDDSIKNFIDLNSKGIPCLLMDSPNNQEWGPVGRIYTLQLEEIEEAFDIWKEMVAGFDGLVNDYRQGISREN